MVNHLTRAAEKAGAKVEQKNHNLGKAGVAVAAGVAGAAAGAAIGLALSDKKSRDKLVKLAMEARDSLERFTSELRASAEDLNIDPDKVRDQLKEGAKRLTQKAKN
jgi:hypothetical protein